MKTRKELIEVTLKNFESEDGNKEPQPEYYSKRGYSCPVGRLMKDPEKFNYHPQIRCDSRIEKIYFNSKDLFSSEPNLSEYDISDLAWLQNLHDSCETVAQFKGELNRNYLLEL